MVTKGIIKEIDGENISVEMFNAGSPEDTASCASGDCASCSAPGKGRIISVKNPKGLHVESGTLIEMELSTTKAFIAGFRVLMLPLIFFIAGFTLVGSLIKPGEGIQIAGGFTGLIAGFLINFLFIKKNRSKEMPDIIRIL